MYAHTYIHTCLYVYCILDVTPWSWSNFNHFHFLSWTLIGLILVLVMGLRPFLLWPKAPIIAG